MKAKRLLIAIVFAATAACRTAQIGAPLVTQTPENLSGDEAQIAVAAMLSATSGDDSKTASAFRGQPFGARIWEESRRAGMTSRGWFLESWDKGVVHAGFQHRSHYMRIAIEQRKGSLTTSILESRNLKQSNGRIHENAIAWVAALESDIRRTLGRASAVKKTAQ